MSDEADDKLGKVFSFDPDKSGVAEDNGHDETFTIPAFLRRDPKKKEPLKSDAAWNDDDFARIAATAAMPVSMEEKSTEHETSETAAEAKTEEPAPINKDHTNIEKAHAEVMESFSAQPIHETPVAPIIAEPSPLHIEPVVPDPRVKTERAASFGENLAGGISAEPRKKSPRVAFDLHHPVTGSRQTGERGPVLQAASEIAKRIGDAKEHSFRRIEPRLDVLEREGEASAKTRAAWRGEDFQPSDLRGGEDVDTRWRLGPALDVRDMETIENVGASDDFWDDNEPGERAGPVRWVALALAVAVGGYAVAHQLDNATPLTTWLPASQQREIAALPPASSQPPPTPAPVAAMRPPARSDTIVPASKPVAVSQSIRPAAPVEIVRKQEARAPVERHEEAHSSTPVILAPGPRSLSAIPATQTSSDVIATGELVMDVQQRLTRLGYANVPLNGRLDANTRSAIMSFQQNDGLPMTGLIDAEMLGRLRQISPAGMRLVKGPDAITPP